MQRHLPLLLLSFLVACDSSTSVDEPAPSSTAAPGTQLGAVTWRSRASMPTPRSQFAVATYTSPKGRTLVYTFGGITGRKVSAAVEAYDPGTNRWSRLAPMPMHLFITNGATVLNDRIYVVGGWTTEENSSPTGAFLEYNPATNTWRNIGTGPCSGNCGNGASGAIGGKLYVYRGNDGTDNETLDVWDPATGRWDTLPKSVNAHDGGGGAVIDGKFYIFGGNDAQMEVFDPIKRTWSPRASMLQLTQYAVGTVLDGKIYVFGDGAIPSSLTQVYDPQTDSWSYGPSMPSPRGGVGVGSVTAPSGRDVAFVMGGSSRINWLGPLATNLRFEPTTAPAGPRPSLGSP